MTTTCTYCGSSAEDTTWLTRFFGREEVTLVECDDCYRARMARLHKDTLTDADREQLREKKE